MARGAISANIGHLFRPPPESPDASFCKPGLLPALSNRVFEILYSGGLEAVEDLEVY